MKSWNYSQCIWGINLEWRCCCCFISSFQDTDWLDDNLVFRKSYGKVTISYGSNLSKSFLDMGPSAVNGTNIYRSFIKDCFLHLRTIAQFLKFNDQEIMPKSWKVFYCCWRRNSYWTGSWILLLVCFSK